MIRALVFSGYGINCEREMAFAVEVAGGSPKIAHLGELLEGKISLSHAQFLLFPGGFSFGDELGAAKALANRLGHLKESLWTFAEKGGCILGVCNGFQLLVKLGLLPAIASQPQQSASLVSNANGAFIAKWVRHTVLPSRCVFTKNLDSLILPIRHGEGRFVAKDKQALRALFDQRHVAFQYAENPNGSQESIAGLTDPSGRILGMMAHPEAALLKTHYPDWTRLKEEARRTNKPLDRFGEGLQIFTNAIRYLEET